MGPRAADLFHDHRRFDEAEARFQDAADPRYTYERLRELGQPAPGGEAAPMLRCAGLFRAFRLLVGDDTEIGTEALEGEVDLAVAAGLMREAETGTGPETAAIDWEAQVDSIARLGTVLNHLRWLTEI